MIADLSATLQDIHSVRTVAPFSLFLLASLGSAAQGEHQAMSWPMVVPFSSVWAIQLEPDSQNDTTACLEGFAARESCVNAFIQQE